MSRVDQVIINRLALSLIPELGRKKTCFLIEDFGGALPIVIATREALIRVGYGTVVSEVSEF